MSSITPDDQQALLNVIHNWPIHFLLTGAEWQRMAFGREIRYPQWAMLDYQPSDSFFDDNNIKILKAHQHGQREPYSCKPPLIIKTCIFYYLVRPVEKCTTRLQLLASLFKDSSAISHEMIYLLQRHEKCKTLFNELLHDKIICIRHEDKSEPNNVFGKIEYYNCRRFNSFISLPPGFHFETQA
jgi:hypothetical protein